MKDFTGNHKIGNIVQDILSLVPGKLYILKNPQFDTMHVVRIDSIEAHGKGYLARYRYVDHANPEKSPTYVYSGSVTLWDFMLQGYKDIFEIDVPVVHDLPVVAGVMFEDLKSWCAFWDTVEEFIPEQFHATGERLYQNSMKDRKAFLRLEFGDLVDKDPIYKDVPNELI